MRNNKTITHLLAVLFLMTPLLWGDILTEYRIHGIENIEKKLDKELTNKEYWQKYLQDKETKFGYIESYPNILTCNKSHATLSLYKKNEQDKYIIKKEYGAFTGKVKGDKYKEGDLKTPVGIYDLVKKISNVDSFYGPLAFVTSYPNIYDSYQGKNGSGIWIHGLPINQERDEFTKGCIAIDNKNLECLDNNIHIEKTLLIINENEVMQDISKERLANILSQLYAWRYAWLYNDIDSYLSFYDQEFKRYDGMVRERFVKYKTRVFAKDEAKTILFQNLNVLPYPNQSDTYKIMFKEIYKSESFSFTGNKVLIVKLVENKLQILTEK